MELPLDVFSGKEVKESFRFLLKGYNYTSFFSLFFFGQTRREDRQRWNVEYCMCISLQTTLLALSVSRWGKGTFGPQGTTSVEKDERVRQENTLKLPEHLLKIYTRTTPLGVSLPPWVGSARSPSVVLGSSRPRPSRERTSKTSVVLSLV